MKRRLTGLLVLVVVYFVGDRLLGYALDSMLSKTRFRYATVYNGQSNAEVLILGNSRAVNSFYAPSIEKRFKTHCLNLAYNGMSPDVAHALLLDYLERNEAPRLVIVEATCVDNESTCISNWKPFWHRSTRLSGIAQRVFPGGLAATRISRLFAFNCELFLRALSYRGQSDQTWINRYSIDQELLRQAARMQPQSLRLPTDEKLSYLRDIVATSAAHEIECRMVVAPYLPDYRRALDNFDQWKARIASSSGDLVDLSSSLAETRFFADRLHTNFAGRHAVIDAAQRAGVFDAVARQ